MALSDHKRLIQTAAILGAATPAILMAVEFARNGPGANPVEEVTHMAGNVGLRLIFISLAITPIRRLFNVRGIAGLRRTFGLAGFLYAALHLATWAYFDLDLVPSAMWQDILRRPFVLGVLLGIRIVWRVRRAAAKSASAQVAPQ